MVNNMVLAAVHYQESIKCNCQRQSKEGNNDKETINELKPFSLNKKVTNTALFVLQRTSASDSLQEAVTTERFQESIITSLQHVKKQLT